MALRNLVEHCQYGDTLETMLRDRTVCGVQDEKIQRRLLEEKNLTFQEAYEIATSMEIASGIQGFRKRKQGHGASGRG